MERAAESIPRGAVLLCAISSPVLAAAMGHVDRSKVSLAGVAILLLGAALARAAPGFDLLLVAGAVMAVGGGW